MSTENFEIELLAQLYILCLQPFLERMKYWILTGRDESESFNAILMNAKSVLNLALLCQPRN